MAGQYRYLADFQAGISYVAVSRVTSLQGLLLEAPFDRQSLYNHTPTEGSYVCVLSCDAFTANYMAGMKMRLADQQRRQAQQLTTHRIHQSTLTRRRLPVRHNWTSLCT